MITTHVRLWAEQMKSAGLVTAKTSLAFHSWTVDTGPLVESNTEIWDDEIAGSLAKGKVDTAAASLRHHLEYASRHLADQLGARPVFRADGNYELGELLPSVLSRMKDLYASLTRNPIILVVDQWSARISVEMAVDSAGSHSIETCCFHEILDVMSSMRGAC